MTSNVASNIINSIISDYHYLVFGRQNNSDGRYIYTPYIGDFVVFRVPTYITRENWFNNRELVKYFENIMFNPHNIMRNNASFVCYWDIKVVVNILNMQFYFEECERNGYYMVVHDLSFGSEFRVKNIEQYFYGNITQEIIMILEETRETYNYIHQSQTILA